MDLEERLFSLSDERQLYIVAPVNTLWLCF